jgi:hypothetical protein
MDTGGFCLKGDIIYPDGPIIILLFIAGEMKCLL